MKRKIIKWVLILIVIGGVVGGGTAIYIFNMPHRDVQAAKVDYNLDVQDLVDEYLDNNESANNKYLSEEGESKILAVTGRVKSVDVNMNGNKVVFLEGNGKSAGVMCTFTKEGSERAAGLVTGKETTIKGVIRSGAGYDEDLGMYEDVIMAKCDVLNSK